ncbi:MAG: TlpA disulfide reductase family protein [Campylobacterota bacterium]|nr:TlpA disulfide reductase family protein [Campylobacterota bacterium]
MKKWVILAILLTIALFLAYRGYSYYIHWKYKKDLVAEYMNNLAPDAIGTTIEGKKWSLKAQKGKDVIIVFWASWCRPCRKEMPNIIALQKRFGDDADAVIISSVLDENVSNIRSFVQERGINYPVLLDEEHPGMKSEFNRNFKIVNIPSIWVVDKKGRVIAQNLLHLDEAMTYIDR